MDFNNTKVKLAFFREAIMCIAEGTLVGCIIYQIFVHLNIAIFGWNLGLIVAPLAAGYVETILANRIIGEGIGAISAFILFIITTVYSFILHNPTLGVNIITVGSIAVILQSAFPTLVNYILMVFGLGIVSYFLGIFKKITNFFRNKLEYVYYKFILKKPHEIVIETVEPFDEARSNEVINSLDFIFITSTDIIDAKFTNIGLFHATVIVDKDKRLIHTEQEKVELTTMNNFKKGKDKCLILLAKNIKEAGGQGVVDLDIQYGLIGLGGDSYQITAMGMGVSFN